MTDENESFSGQAVRGYAGPPPYKYGDPKTTGAANVPLDSLPAFLRTPEPPKGLNPKTAMGRRKVPMLSVVPPAALAYLGMAMRYGAHEAPRADGGTGYGPYNWRDQPVEASTYVDAAMRHLAEFWDGQDTDPKSLVPHLAHAMASIGILVDAIENGTCADDRPKVRGEVMSKILQRETRSF